jgi:hypothetical protein
LAAALAVTETLPLLTEIVARPNDEDDVDGRLRSLAIDAIVAVTKVDLRRDASGKVRPLKDVSLDYMGRWPRTTSVSK